jgi:hypothetical protein
MSRIVLLLIPPVLLRKMSPKMLKNSKRISQKLKITVKRSGLNRSSAYFPLVRRWTPTVRRKWSLALWFWIAWSAVRNCPSAVRRYLTMAPGFTVLLVTFSSDFRFASNLCRSSSFPMGFHLILKNNKI